MNEEELNQKSCPTSAYSHKKMRNVRSDGSKNKPASYRLYKTYGGSCSLYEMPCKGTFKTSGYCDMCGLRENIRSEMAQEDSKDMQPGMPCCVWKNMRTKAMEHYWDGGEPDVSRVIDKCENRIDRIKCLGNAVVPQQFYVFFQLIMDIEKGKTDAAED